ncbi:MAG: prepilin peptidase, partial [Proteobacteria bacterium]|nr:prepilin peptidase [Pseudomonadota bacterium]
NRAALRTKPQILVYAFCHDQFFRASLEPIMNTSRTLVLLIILAASAWYDGKQGRIPNGTVLFGMVAGLVLYTASDGATGLVTSIEGLGLALLLLGPVYLLGFLGAGDVKLVAAVGSLLGPRALVETLPYIFICGGVLALAIAVAGGQLVALARNLAQILNGAAIDLGLGQLPQTVPSGSSIGRLAFAIPIAGGIVVWLCRTHVGGS